MRRRAAAAWALALSASLWAFDKKSSMLGPGVPPSSFGGSSGQVLPGLSEDGSVTIDLLTPEPNAVLNASDSAELRVRVRVADAPSVDAGLRAIAPDSVRFELFAQGEAAPTLVGSLTGPQPDGQWSARLDLAVVPTARYLVRVTAATLSGSRGRAERTVLVDHGPRVQVLSPGEGSSYKGSMAVSVIVDYAPFGPGPMPAHLTVAGKPGPALAPSADGTTLQAQVSFDAFEPALEGPYIFRVDAANDQGTSTQVSRTFVVDVTGPVVAMTEPEPGTVVGGVIRVRLVAADPSGVLGTSVRAIIGNARDAAFELPLEPERGTAGAFSAVFDTRKLTRCGPRSAGKNELCLVWPSVSFRLSDRLGNERTVAYEFGVDNQPPLIDLQPKLVYPTRLAKSVFECGVPFDPVGGWFRDGDPPDDGCAVPQVYDVRAYVADQSNQASGLKVAPLALVDEDTVAAYVHTDVQQPLVVDTNGDGICDAINPKLVPTTRSPRATGEVLKLRLRAVPPTGGGDFIAHAFDAFEDTLGCAQPGDLPAKFVCSAFAPQTMVIGYWRLDGPWPAIYGLEPISPAAEPACAGSQLDAFANAIGSGAWICTAVAAHDKVGNASVSAPMRSFVSYRGEAIQRRSGACPLPPANAPPMPACTGRFDAAKGEIIAGTCTPPPERFEGGEYRVDR